MFNLYLRLLNRLHRLALPFKMKLKTEAIIKGILREKKQIYLELGSGPKKGSASWLTIDMNRQCDLCWDLREGLPFPTGSVKIIYSSHFFEHLTFKEITNLLSDCHRVLQNGGIFSICVPNARLFVENYIYGESKHPQIRCNYKPAYNNINGIDYINYIAYMDQQHKYMFDEENILVILENCGFQFCSIRPFDPSLDMPERRPQSVYAMAIK